MKITYKQKPEDPAHPVMEGKGPIAKEFNKRQVQLFIDKKFIEFEPEDTKKDKENKIFKQITMVFMEILADEYDKNHKSVKKIKEG